MSKSRHAPSVRMAAGPLVFLLALGLSACGGETVTSCNIIDDASLCYETKVPDSAVDAEETTCESGDFGSAGTFKEDDCTSANRVGVCDQDDADNDIHYYSTGGAPFTAGTAETDCDSQPGTFSAD
ncbi:MAG: hypothetical protein IT285_12640 [Bdellovibrionales bacterium]|nr:hypothetical protein [Bdellovibrionales bacterium]